MATPVATGLTVADLETLPEREGVVYELVGGKLYVRGRAVLRHQRVAGRILRRFMEWTDVHGGEAYMEPGVVLTEEDAVVPDVVLVAAPKAAALDPRHVDVAPDLVVEVSSPGTRDLDHAGKRALYERVGVPEYWFVDLDAERVEVYRLAGGGYGPPAIIDRGVELEPPHLPGLVVDVDDALGQAG